ncbi:MAG: tryptophan synthase subunit alpha [Verrucomicrobia bacterium]|nr:MAG: tryptophan synthase subunit alpha [Verrucomicrobiota bacterium]
MLISHKAGHDSRIDFVFSQLRSQKKKALVTYITGGDPSAKKTLEIALTLEQAGVDILELGIPFSDPGADGPTIQAASERALRAGASVEKILEIVCTLRRESSLPVVLFTYLNPIYSYGFKRFLTDAASAGADGLLVLDLPPQEVPFHEDLNVKSALQAVQLVTPTTSEDRIRTIVQTAQGFIYYVLYEGVTGTQAGFAENLTTQIQKIRCHTPLPIAVGFGISTPEQVKSAAAHADAAVVGSALVACIAKYSSSPDLLKQVENFVRPLAEAAREA